MAKDYYSTLGLNKEASQDEIKRAFRKLAVEHHPDHGGDQEKFKEINEAYSILSDPDKRNQYDNPDPFGSIFGDIFNFRNRRRGPQPDSPRKGPEIRIEVDVPIGTFILGGKVDLKINFEEACADCNGQGASAFESCQACGGRGFIERTQNNGGMFIRSSGPCHECNGKGKKPTEKCETCSGAGKVEVHQKPIEFELINGARDGNIVVLRGQGRRGIFGGPPGDILIKANMIIPDPNQLTEEQKEVLKSL